MNVLPITLIFAAAAAQLAPVPGGDIEIPRPDPLPVLTGRVGKALLKSAPCWIRVVSIHTGTTQTIEIDPSGAFSVRDLMPGRYMLFVMNGGDLVHSRLVEVRRASHEVGINP